MSKLLKRYNKGQSRLDTQFDQTTMLNRYSNYDPEYSTPSGPNLLNQYYQEFGYTAMIASAGGFLLGTNSATQVLQSGISALVPGATRGGIASLAIRTANTFLRNPFIENTINGLLPTPNILNIPSSRMEFQTVPPSMFLATNPPIISPASNATSPSLFLNTVVYAAQNLIIPTVQNLAATGQFNPLNTYDQFLNQGLNVAEIMVLASQGIKYTKPVAWIDTTKPKWSNRLGDFFTYDKYIGYAGEGDLLNYSRIREQYGDTLEQRWTNWKEAGNYSSYYNPSNFNPGAGINFPPIPDKAIPAMPSKISNDLNKKNADNVKLYHSHLGTEVAGTQPEEFYTNQPEIREKITRLGFPQFNRKESEDFGTDEYLDKINMMDVGDDYTDELQDIIKFRIFDIFNKEAIIFRATLTGISDTISPNWNDATYLGRADSFYTYSKTTRELAFGITVYAQSKDEVTPQWRKINRIVGLCYPTEYKNDNAMRGPIVQLTLGDLYNDVYGFFSSVSVKPDENSMWDIDDGFQLPQIVSLDISFTYMYGEATPQTKIKHFNQNATAFDIVQKSQTQTEKDKRAQGARSNIPSGFPGGG
jgi:hypothetical protein